MCFKKSSLRFRESSFIEGNEVIIKKNQVFVTSFITSSSYAALATFFVSGSEVRFFVIIGFLRKFACSSISSKPIGGTTILVHNTVIVILFFLTLRLLAVASAVFERYISEIEEV